MRPYLSFILVTVALSCAPHEPPIRPVPRSTATLSIASPGNRLPRLVDTTIQLAVIFVDFADGRMADGSLPTKDEDTAHFKGEAIYAVGSMGWVREDDGNPASPLRKKIRKYRYDDYWNMYFSDSTYVDDSARGTHPSPDYQSHGTRVFGSMRDYYRETSYGNLMVAPAKTRSGPADRYHTGIVNNIDSADGRKYVRWIRLNGPKSAYQDNKVGILAPALKAVDSLHKLPKSHRDHLEFDPASFTGKYAVVGAGSNVGGATFYFNQAYGVSEKAYYVPNWFPESKLDGILQTVHEFAHTLGLDHIALGSFDPMHWGGETEIAQQCPPHFNPLTKYLLGWLSNEEVIVIDSTVENVALRPSHLKPGNDIPSAAFIALIPKSTKAGIRKGVPRREYLIIEYRTREGFNRFSGGSALPKGSDFTGGALVWRFSTESKFGYKISDQISRYLNIEVPGYGADYTRGKDQSPGDYFTPGKELGPSSGHPTTNLLDGTETGIVIDNFRIEGGVMRMDVRYPG